MPSVLKGIGIVSSQSTYFVDLPAKTVLRGVGINALVNWNEIRFSSSTVLKGIDINRKDVYKTRKLFGAWMED